MSVFKHNIDYSTDKKLIGCYIDRDDAERIALYSVINRVSRSKMMQHLMGEWLKKIPTYDQLVDMLAEVTLQGWRAKQLENATSNAWKSVEQISRRWDEYKKEVSVELRTRRIPRRTINDILHKTEEKQI